MQMALKHQHCVNIKDVLNWMAVMIIIMKYEYFVELLMKIGNTKNIEIV